MTIHDFDLARFMLDEEPEDVFAIGGRLIDAAADERAERFRHRDVRPAHRERQAVPSSTTRARSAYGYDQRVELLGTTGMVISGNRKPHEVTHFSAKPHRAGRSPYLDFFAERYREAFDAEIGAFVEAVEKGVAPEVGFEDGRRR